GLFGRVDLARALGDDLALALDGPLAVRLVDDGDLPGVLLVRLVAIDLKRNDLPGALVPLAVLLDRLLLGIAGGEGRSHGEQQTDANSDVCVPSHGGPPGGMSCLPECHSRNQWGKGESWLLPRVGPQHRPVLGGLTA